MEDNKYWEAYIETTMNWKKWKLNMWYRCSEKCTKWTEVICLCEFTTNQNDIWN